MGSLLATVVPLAAGSAISPAIITLQLVTLSGRTEPLKRSFAIAAGFTLVAIGVCVLAFALGKGVAEHHHSQAGAIVKLVAAGLLFVLGIRALRRTPVEKPPKAEDSAHLGRAFSLGAALMATNITSILLVFPAAHAVGISDVDTAGKALAFAIVLGFLVLPAIGPPLLVAALGERGTQAMARLNAFTTAHRQAIRATICFAFAIFLAVVGIEAL